MKNYNWAFGLLTVVVVAMVVRGGSNRPAQRVVSDPVPMNRRAPGVSGRPVTPAAGMAGEMTLAYWKHFLGLPAQMSPDLNAGPERQIGAFREAARVIRQCPTSGVDPQLVDWALRTAVLLDERADLIESARDPALLAEAFARGLQGDPFGVSIEMNQAERAWVARFRAVAREEHQLRAALSARYGIRFP